MSLGLRHRRGLQNLLRLMSSYSHALLCVELGFGGDVYSVTEMSLDLTVEKVIENCDLEFVYVFRNLKPCPLCEEESGFGGDVLCHLLSEHGQERSLD